MNNFDFYNPTRIIFGKGTHKNVGEEVKKYSSRVLLHYGGGSVKKNGIYGDVTASLKNAGVEFIELGGVVPNPRLSLVREGVKLCKKEKIDFILAVGGGSVIDSAKAISLGVYYDGDVWDFFSKKIAAQKTIPLAAVLTIPAAGSESSWSTVITDEETKMKVGYYSNLYRPVFSILNPEVCFSLPKNQAAAGVCDIMAHIMERYITQTKNTDVSDGLCESVYKAVVKNAPKVLKNPQDYGAWAEIMWGGNMAHNGLLGMGRQEDWASHGMEHSLSAVHDLTHGAGLAIIFPAWMKYVYKENLEMFERFAKNMWGVEDLRGEKAALEAISRMEKFFKSLGLPTRLSDVNITASEIPLFVEKAQTYGSKGFFKKLSARDMMNIYKLAL